MNPFIQLISTVISLINMLIFAWIILSLLIYFNIVNRSHPLVYKIDLFLNRLLEPLLKPIRKIIPPISGVDISPVVLLIGLSFIENIMFYYFYRY